MQVLAYRPTIIYHFHMVAFDIKALVVPWGRRVIGISGSLIWSETLMELIFNPCGEFW